MPVYQLQAYNFEEITPNDNANISIGGIPISDSIESGVCLYVGVGGDIKVTSIGGQIATFQNVASGSFLPIQVKRLWQTGTNATGIIALT